MRAKLSNKATVLLVMGILSIMFCLIVANSSHIKYSTNEKVSFPIKASSIENFERIVDEFQVNDYWNDDQFFPSVCALTSDSFAVTWTSDGQDGDLYGIYSRVFNATTGNNITAEFRVNDYTTSSQLGSSICALSSDLFAVSWTSYEQDGSYYGVYAKVVNATTGNSKTAEFRVNNYTTSDQWAGSICALSEESFVVAWTSYGQDGQTNGIFATVFDANTGKNVTSEIQVNDYTTDDQDNPSICALSSDSFVVAWQSYEQDGSDYGVYARVFNATTGTSLSAEFRVNDYTINAQAYASICALSSDSFVVAWVSDEQDGSSLGAYARVFNATTGTSLSAEFRVNNYTTGAQSCPSICTLSSDSFVVAWSSNWQDGDVNGVYAAVFGLSSGNGGDSEPSIPAYNPFFLIGIMLVVLAFLIRKHHNSNS